MKNVVLWDVSLCGSCRNRRFGGTYHFHFQGENNQRTKSTLAGASNCNALRRINHYIKMEATEWDILHIIVPQKTTFFIEINVVCKFKD
jgi:hypothetical protein